MKSIHSQSRSSSPVSEHLEAFYPQSGSLLVNNEDVQSNMKMGIKESEPSSSKIIFTHIEDKNGKILVKIEEEKKDKSQNANSYSRSEKQASEKITVCKQISSYSKEGSKLENNRVIPGSDSKSSLSSISSTFRKMFTGGKSQQDNSKSKSAIQNKRQSRIDKKTKSSGYFRQRYESGRITNEDASSAYKNSKNILPEDTNSSSSFIDGKCNSIVVIAPGTLDDQKPGIIYSNVPGKDENQTQRPQNSHERIEILTSTLFPMLYSVKTSFSTESAQTNSWLKNDVQKDKSSINNDIKDRPYYPKSKVAQSPIQPTIEESLDEEPGLGLSYELFKTKIEKSSKVIYIPDSNTTSNGSNHLSIGSAKICERLGMKNCMLPEFLTLALACPICRQGTVEKQFTCSGLCCAFAFFPFGLIFLYKLRQYRCIICGYSPNRKF